MSRKVLITGTAGFIGFHLATRLLERGDEVVGLDSINDYYDVRLKYGRLARHGIDREHVRYGALLQSRTIPQYRFIQLNLEDQQAVLGLFDRVHFDGVCHLAAQAGVRYSLLNPHAYINSNIVGFLNILEACRRSTTGHLVYASSSSVYGLNEEMPFATHHNVDHPVSLYAASKKSNELMAHSYSHLFGVPTTGLRFFTAYGPWGRPDMAIFIFTRAILEGRAIDVYNNGQMQRDFTYIDDLINGVVRTLDRPAQGNPAWSGTCPDPASSRAPFKIYNIGNNSPVKLLDFIEAIERALGIPAQKNLLPMQPGDVPATWADVHDLVADLGYAPDTPLEQGVQKFVRWYRDFYKV